MPAGNPDETAAAPGSSPWCPGSRTWLAVRNPYRTGWASRA